MMSKIMSDRGDNTAVAETSAFVVDVSDVAREPADILGALEAAGVSGVSDGWLAAVADRAATAAMAADVERLLAVLDMIRRLDTSFAARGDDAGSRRALAALGELIGALLDRIRAQTPPFKATSERGRVLLAIGAAEGASNEDLAEATSLAITQISRTGKRLSDAGLARAVHLGRVNSWQLTPRGQRALALVKSALASTTTRTTRPTQGRAAAKKAAKAATRMRTTKAEPPQYIAASGTGRTGASYRKATATGTGRTGKAAAAKAVGKKAASKQAAGKAVRKQAARKQASRRKAKV